MRGAAKQIVKGKKKEKRVKGKKKGYREKGKG
jgi:hypothetical protein